MLSLLLASAGLGYYLWPNRAVELDRQGYDLTLALFRTCNQRDVESLDAIERLVDQPSTKQNLSDESRSVVGKAIELAKTGRWREAEIDCRQALDNQVRRH
ncbi:MAG: hypothetical protein WBD31_17815 [Rubripirellula sp.]